MRVHAFSQHFRDTDVRIVSAGLLLGNTETSTQWNKILKQILKF